MKISKKLLAFEEEAKKTDEYWVEKAKLDFSLLIHDRLKKAGMTCAQLAMKIKASGPYISKVFRGESNLTIESMIKLSRATGGELRIEIVDMTAVQPVWVGQPRKCPVITLNATTTEAQYDSGDFPELPLAA